MSISGSLAFNLLPSDPERDRIRELSRYYCCTNQQSPSPTATIVDENTTNPTVDDAPTGDEQPSAGVLSADITLTALAQLGVLRLGCNRAFVSLIDGDNQHIIAEATASISIRDRDKHLPQDGIYLGVRSLDLVWGVCPHTIRLFTAQDNSIEVDTENVTANRTRYIIRDFNRDDCFKDRPYVLEWPYMRFYAEVPLTSPSGYVLGSYCVVDDKPRDEFSEEDVEILQEISDAIANHLENKRIAHCHSRFERLMTGMTDFSKNHRGFDPINSSESLVESASSTSSSSRINGNTPISPSSVLEPESPLVDGSTDLNLSDSKSSSSVQTEQQPASFFTDNPSSFTELSSIQSNLSLGQPSPGEERSLDSINEVMVLATRSAPNNESLVSFSDSATALDRIQTIFSRASILLRDAMNLDGVMFLDAGRSRPSFMPPKGHAWEPLPRATTQIDNSNVFPTPLLPGGEAQHNTTQCEVLGQAVKSQNQGSSFTETQAIPYEDLLDAMFRSCPQGQVINMDILPEDDDKLPSKCTSTDFTFKDSELNSSSMTQILRSLFPNAKSMIWLPLWDHQKSRWMAGMFSWSSENHRALGVDELHYFKVFADSIVSEVSRVTWSSTEKSKFDLLSSLSHELRSPLHGILASAELLHGTALESSQEEMIKMIEVSGLTLLETTDHLLTYCKINNSSQDKGLNGRRQRDDLLILENDFDLGSLVEEVTNILYTGQQDPSLLTRTAATSMKVPNSVGVIYSSEKPSVVVRIDQSHSWKIRSLPGAWRRIVMNILGNSLKWTSRGLIEISLSMLESSEDPGKSLAHGSFIDTGRGIAPEFLKHELFTPFAQEDRLVEGVGLGLSIVHQLVTSLNGHINVRSEKGHGTQVDIYIPVQDLKTSTKAHSPPILAQHPRTLQASLVAFNGYPDIKEPPTGMLTVDAKRKISIQSMLADVFMSNPGWTVSLAESITKGQGEVAVLESSTLEEMSRSTSPTRIASDNGFKAIIVLKDKPSAFEKTTDESLIWISPPFGPKKIQNAIDRFLVQLRLSQMETELNQSTPQSIFPERSSSYPIEGPPVLVETTPLGELPIQIQQPLGGLQSLPDQKARHVLVVDDNEINIKIMAAFMRKVGCSYETASNGLIALEKFKSCDRRYDYILMDISMPVMDGLVSTSKIRHFERKNKLKSSCIMAVTGVASDAMHQQALAAGVDRYLVKPLSLRELKKIII